MFRQSYLSLSASALTRIMQKYLSAEGLVSLRLAIKAFSRQWRHIAGCADTHEVLKFEGR